MTMTYNGASACALKEKDLAQQALEYLQFSQWHKHVKKNSKCMVTLTLEAGSKP